MGTITFGHTPAFHFMTDQLPCAAASAAPQSPPMREWLELDGNPNHHVAMFQAKAAMTEQSTVGIVTTSVSTSPLPIVDATAPPSSAPVRLKNAAMAIAFARRQGSRRDHRGDRIGSVVKTVAVFENDRRNDDRKKSKHQPQPTTNTSAPLRGRYFPHPGSCRPLFPSTRTDRAENCLLRFVLALVKIAQQIEFKFVGVALDRLEFCVHLARRRRRCPRAVVSPSRARSRPIDREALLVCGNYVPTSPAGRSKHVRRFFRPFSGFYKAADSA